jgi:hypothetical protein
LTQLNQYEEQIIKKIQNFETLDVEDLSLTVLNQGLQVVLNKSA